MFQKKIKHFKAFTICCLFLDNLFIYFAKKINELSINKHRSFYPKMLRSICFMDNLLTITMTIIRQIIG